jgi:hypothetical protein
MATIVPCSSALGRLSVYTTTAPAPVVVTFDYPTQTSSSNAVTWTANPQPLRTIGLATGLRLGQEVAAQFQPAFDASIYVTPFGDLPGAVEIDFLANRNCDESNEALDIIQQYLRMRLLPTEITSYPTFQIRHTPRQTITIGRSAFTGYITKLDFTAQTQDAISIGARLSMKAWPV